MPSPKEEAIARIKKMPEDADFSDIMAELYTLQKANILKNQPVMVSPPRVVEPKRMGRPKKQ